MPGFRRLGKKITNNSLTNKDKLKLFSVYKLYTEAYLSVPIPASYVLWYYDNFNEPANAQQWPH